MVQNGAVPESHKPVLGMISAIMGVLATFGLAAIWMVSTVPWFDMPGWLRIVSGWMIPVGVLGAIGFGIAGRLKRSGVGLSTVGLVLAGACVVGFIVMILANPY